jgi:hypothetical protein
MSLCGMWNMSDWQAAYDQLSRKFSPWMTWRGRSGCDFMRNAGVYLFAELPDDSVAPSDVDPGIVYIGGTTKQTLLARFIQFPTLVGHGALCNGTESARVHRCESQTISREANRTRLPPDGILLTRANLRGEFASWKKVEHKFGMTQVRPRG